MKQISGKEYLIAAVVGFLIGLRLIGSAVGIVYVGAAAVCFYYAFKNDYFRLFAILPYVVFTEIFVRSASNGVTYLPYNFLEYFLIALFMLMLLSKGGELKLHSRCALPIFLYAIVELLDTIRASDLIYAKSMATNSLVLTAIALWASANPLSPKITAHLIKHLVLASVYLCGNIMVAHFTHDITYMLVSSSEATNRMAPVQVSAYLGAGSIILFLYVMQERSKQHFILHLFVLTVMITLMVLSFSRGGLYFLASIIALYSLLNWKQIGRFAIMLLFIPIAYIIYYFVIDTTGGLIERRYTDKGNSGRTELMEAGMTIFVQEPLAGVGTGNYGKEIVKRDLYFVESGAHNEFVRAAAEHGILGIIFYWGFMAVISFEILSRKKAQRDFGLYLFLLFNLTIVHNGLKTGVQFYILAIILATPTVISVKRKKNVPYTDYLPSATS